jgi:3-methyladenine DNA glycosylase/8-oxoguanine DNA glycosylase
MPSQDGTIIITPQRLLRHPSVISRRTYFQRKASYIADATLRILSGGLDLEALRSMSEQEVCGGAHGALVRGSLTARCC